MSQLLADQHFWCKLIGITVVAVFAFRGAFRYLLKIMRNDELSDYQESVKPKTIKGKCEGHK